MTCYGSLEEGENRQGWGVRTRATLMAEEGFEQRLDEYIKSQCMVLNETGWAGRGPKSISPGKLFHKTK